MVIPSTLALINIKLDRSNYLFWKTQIIPTARAYDLKAFLLSIKSKPDEVIADSSNPVVSINNQNMFPE